MHTKSLRGSSQPLVSSSSSSTLSVSSKSSASNEACVSDPLARLGFDAREAASFAPLAALGLVAARVVAEHRGGFIVAGELGDAHAELTGRLRHEVASRVDLPAVGDWVAIRLHGDRATIHAVLPRRSVFVRAVAGGTTVPQVIAANVDVAVVACALDRDLSARRIERYLAAIRATGARAIVALTKADLVDAGELDLGAIERAVGDASVHLVSSVTGEGVDAIAASVRDRETVAIVGSSGVGKSSLVNRLAGRELRATSELGAGGRGAHTTTSRELVVLDRFLVLDTPGMRELRLWDVGDDDLASEFADVHAFAERCRFRDCAHEGEPGCAIALAIDEGELDPERFASFTKLEREAIAMERRKDARSAAEDKRKWKTIARANRARDRARGR